MLEFQCRADEYLEARRAVLRLRRLECWMNLGWGPTLLVVGLVVIARAPLDVIGYLVTAVGVALVLNGTWWFLRRVRVEWRTTPSLAYRTWMEIHDMGFSFRTVDGEIDVPWSSLDQIIETPRTFVLYRSPDDLRVVPKRAFASRSDVASFRARLAAICAAQPGGTQRPSFRFEVEARPSQEPANDTPKRRQGGIPQ
jgi:hypothetical protein